MGRHPARRAAGGWHDSLRIITHPYINKAILAVKLLTPRDPAATYPSLSPSLSPTPASLLRANTTLLMLGAPPLHRQHRFPSPLLHRRRCSPSPLFCHRRCSPLLPCVAGAAPPPHPLSPAPLPVSSTPPRRHSPSPLLRHRRHSPTPLLNLPAPLPPPRLHRRRCSPSPLLHRATASLPRGHGTRTVPILHGLTRHKIGPWARAWAEDAT
jgi:hypothetical protein